MSRYRGSGMKREHFRRYLERAGVTSSLNSVLASLFEQHEKPENALEFVKEHLGVAQLIAANNDDLEQAVTELKQKLAHLEEENKDLKKRLQSYEEEEDEDCAKAD